MKDAVHFFDPEDIKQIAQTWCRKIDELREVHGGTEDATVHFAMVKLREMSDFNTIKFTWHE